VCVGVCVGVCGWVCACGGGGVRVWGHGPHGQTTWGARDGWAQHSPHRHLPHTARTVRGGGRAIYEHLPKSPAPFSHRARLVGEPWATKPGCRSCSRGTSVARPSKSSPWSRRQSPGARHAAREGKRTPHINQAHVETLHGRKGNACVQVRWGWGYGEAWVGDGGGVGWVSGWVVVHAWGRVGGRVMVRARADVCGRAVCG
jgi:hypothetical protein